MVLTILGVLAIGSAAYAALLHVRYGRVVNDLDALKRHQDLLDFQRRTGGAS